MENVIIETVVQILATLFITLIGVLGTWLTTKIATRNELASISDATHEVVYAAQLTVRELQQTVVDGWKAASVDGKLTQDEIAELGNMLVDKTLDKMSEPAIKLLQSAGVDIDAMIQGAGEAMIQSMKR